MTRVPTVGIIGGGFCGMMTAINLGRSSTNPIKIVIFNAGHPFGRGVAFSPYSKNHLLNVPAGKMSALSREPDHFVNWILEHHYFHGLTEPSLISGSYLPRIFYGDYLEDVWQAFLNCKSKSTGLQVIEEYATDMNYDGNVYTIVAGDHHVKCDFVVLASGNSVPAFPSLQTPNFQFSPRYFGNPWSELSVASQTYKGDVLIAGNGLTMVDTVLGLMERGFPGTIYSISPDGFTILSHRHSGSVYSKMQEELRSETRPYRLQRIVKIFSKHIKLVRKLGLSAEPVVDSLRPFTQEIWKDLTLDEKSKFLSRLRHLWGVARHRLPVHTHDVIQRLRIDGRLKVVAGKLVKVVESGDLLEVTFYNKKTKKTEVILVERVINCTGPATDVLESDNLFLKSLLAKGLLKRDRLKLGIEINTETLNVVGTGEQEQGRFYAIGNLIKGMLWESTAVPELRVQAEKVAGEILDAVSTPVSQPFEIPKV